MTIVWTILGVASLVTAFLMGMERGESNAAKRHERAALASTPHPPEGRHDR